MDYGIKDILQWGKMKNRLLSFVVMLSTLLLLFKFFYINPLIMLIFICVQYLFNIPKFLLSPQNIIFAYYFLWYGIAPNFAGMFSDYTFKSKEENLAFLMIFFTYGISLILLTYFDINTINVSINNRKKEIIKPIFKPDIDKILKITMILVVLSLIIFIFSTGGIANWTKDSENAYIARKGSGWIYLIFLHSLILYTASYGIKYYKNKKKIIQHLCILLLLLPFVGSKAQLILLIFILLSPVLIKQKLIGKKTIIPILISIVVFYLGFYQRNYSRISFIDLFESSLNYFNTYEMLVTLVRDFDPSFFKTFFLPINKILLLFGKYINVPFHDMSMWLTSIYYPETAKLMGTQQWPIEADFYMSFYYILGIPFLGAYLWWISFALKKAREGYIAWVIIYMIEFVYILSHFRGSLLNYWYIWLLPFYLFVIALFKNTKIPDFKIEM